MINHGHPELSGHHGRKGDAPKEAHVQWVPIENEQNHI